MPTRRRLLSGVALASVGLGGCLSLGSSGASARIADVSVLMLYDEPVTLDIRIASDDEVLLDETYSFEPDAGDESTFGRVFDEPWMDEPGQFELTIDASTTDETVTREIPNRGPGCYGVIVRVHSDGTVDVPMDAEAAGC